MRCAECGNDNPEQAVFCMICGARFSPRREEPPPAPPHRPAHQPVPEPMPPPRLERPAQPAPPAPKPAQSPPAAPPPPGPMRDAAEPLPPLFAPPPAAAAPRPDAGTRPAPAPPPPPAVEAAPPPPSTPPSAATPPPAAETAPVMETVELPPPPAPPSERPTTPIWPVEAPPAAMRAGDRVVCPQCYAQNPRGNLCCQECGSRLPGILTGESSAVIPGGTVPLPTQPVPPPAAAPAPAAPAAAPAPAPRVTVYVPPQPASGAPAAASRSAGSGSRGFGLADILAVFSLLALGAAVSPLFKWAEGSELSAFGFQGVNKPGGPGLLPYSGVEWLTVGAVAAAALGLALVFLIVRAGRGPMFMLAGWLALAPFIYLALQGLLPLRAQGVELQDAPGFSVVFFGGGPAQQAALTPAIWLMTGAGALLLLAGFLAPPRGWGRLLSFLLFGLAVAGLAFFCAVAYNWNLFIPEQVPRLLPPLLPPPA